MALQEQTIVWDERIGGFTSFLTYVPDTGFSLNNRHFTLGDGGAYEHNREDTARGTFYGQTSPAEVAVIFNDSPSSIKSFRTIGYEGLGNWSAEIVTDKESEILDSTTIPPERSVSGDILAEDFVDREGKFFSYIRGKDREYNTPDITTLLVEGIGVGEVLGDEVTVSNIPAGTAQEQLCDQALFPGCTPDSRWPGDRLFFYKPLDGDYDINNLLYAGEIIKIDGNTLTYAVVVEAEGYIHHGNDTWQNTSGIRQYTTFATDFINQVEPNGSKVWVQIPVDAIVPDAPTSNAVVNDSFFLISKNEAAETAGLKGFFAIVKMSSDSTGMSELFSISSEVSQSSS